MQSLAELSFPSSRPTTAEFVEAISCSISDRRTALSHVLDALQPQAGAIGEVALLLTETLRDGRRVLVAGNGGSAAEAQHFATELVGRFKRERNPWPVMALTADTAMLTAIANDYGFETVFSRQVAAFGGAGDVLVAFSTSGNSENLVQAAEAATQRGMAVVAITGPCPNRLASMADRVINVPISDVPVIQEIHAVVLHILCELVESSLAGAAR
jgi:D-sedoheptulose 7-phosphate isomerase